MTFDRCCACEGVGCLGGGLLLDLLVLPLRHPFLCLCLCCILHSLLPSAPILGTHPGSSSSSAGAWSPARTDSSASPSPYVLPNCLLSVGDLVNKAFGVGMIEGVTTCSLSLRAEVRACVTTPASLALRVLRARTASSAVVDRCWLKSGWVIPPISSRERVLFIGTQFSILYTSMYSPATPDHAFQLLHLRV